MKVKENRRMPIQVIEQVYEKFQFRGFHVCHLLKTTLNKYVAKNLGRVPDLKRILWLDVNARLSADCAHS
jgi:hypothetical protein